MIFPILKKIGYFLGILFCLGAVVGLIGIAVEDYRKYQDLGWGLFILAFVSFPVYGAYYCFSEFKSYNLKNHIECSEDVFLYEIKTIAEYTAIALLVCLLCIGFASLGRVIIWTVNSFPDFLLHYLKVGPSLELYRELKNIAGYGYTAETSVFLLLIGGIFAILCFFGAICLLQCFLIKKLLLEKRDKKMADAIEMLSKKLGEINCKAGDAVNEIPESYKKEK